LPGKDCQERTARIGLPGQDCQDRTVVARLPRLGCQDRTARRSQAGQDRKKRIARKLN
jgi:hypothetical protein